jgi:hypothetical protein
MERATSIATQPSMQTLRKDKDTKKAHVRNVRTWTRNQRKEPRKLIELKRNSFLPIIKKKFGPKKMCVCVCVICYFLNLSFI